MPTIILPILFTAFALLFYKWFVHQTRITSTSRLETDRSTESKPSTNNNVGSKERSGPSLAEKSEHMDPRDEMVEERKDDQIPIIIAPAEQQDSVALNTSINRYPQAFKLTPMRPLSPIMLATPGSDASALSEEELEGETPLTPPSTKDFLNGRVQDQQSPYNKAARKAAMRSATQSLMGEEEENGDILGTGQESYFPSMPEPRRLFPGNQAISHLESANDLCEDGPESFLRDARTGAGTENDKEFSLHVNQAIESSPFNTITTSKTRANTKREIKEIREIEAERQEIVDNESGISANLHALQSGTTTKNTILNEIIPYALLYRLKEDPTLCVASNSSAPPTSRCAEKPCNYPRAIASLNHASSMLRRLQKHIDHRRFHYFVKDVGNVLPFALCETHCIRAMCEDRLGILKRFLKQWSRPTSDSQSMELPEISTQEFFEWMKAIWDPVKLELDPTSDTSDDISPQPLNSIKFTRRINSFPITHKKPWQPQRSKEKSISESIQEVIWDMLTPKEVRPGYIYVFGHDSETSMRKIGFTEYSPSKRLRKWNSDCQRTHCFDQSTWLHEIPHAKRVEKLIHTELKELRMEIECTACKTRLHRENHREWFEGHQESLAHFEKVIQKWISWIKTIPYEETFNGRWSLKTTVIPTLREICEPLSLVNPTEGGPVAADPFIGPKSALSAEIMPVVPQDPKPTRQRKASKSSSKNNCKRTTKSITRAYLTTTSGMPRSDDARRRIEPAEDDETTAVIHEENTRRHHRYDLRATKAVKYPK